MRDQGLCPWQGRLHYPVWLWQCQRQPHRPLHHDFGMQDWLRQAGDRRGASLPLLEAA